jgi:hypothetical protein
MNARTLASRLAPELFPGRYLREPDVYADLKAALVAAAGPEAVVQVQQQDYDVIRPVEAFAQRFWPDAVVRLGSTSIAVEAKLLRHRQESGAISSAIAQAMGFTLEYDQALIVLLRADGCPEFTANERDLLGRLWTSHSIAVAIVAVPAATQVQSAAPQRGCRSRGGCRKESEPELATYEAIVADYIKSHRLRAAREMEFFKRLPSLGEAIHLAALAKTAQGKRHDHQRRISASTLSEAERRLQAAAPSLARCRTFAELHDAVQATLRTVHGIGDLCMYDTATRIGAHLELEPEQVYLHAGTATGARALGFNGLTALDPMLLPPEFRSLKPREIEDCLCIYKDELSLRRATDASH